MVFLFSLLLFQDMALLSRFEGAPLLKANTVVRDEEIPAFFTQVERIGDHGLVLFSIPDKTVFYKNFHSGGFKIIARDGEGPGELKGGPIYGSIRGEEIIIAEKDTNRLLAFNLKGQSRIVARSTPPVKSLVFLESGLIYGVSLTLKNVFYDDKYSPVKVPDGALVLLRSEGDAEWAYQGTIFDDDMMKDLHLDSRYNHKTSLFKINDQRFYRVPYLGSRVLQVFDQRGNVVREIEIPHPWNDTMPETPFSRMNKMGEGKHLRLITSASIDENGTLHILLESMLDPETQKKNYSSRYVVQIDENGTFLRVFLLEKPVNRLVVEHDGRGYYAFDYKDEHLLHFSID